MHATVLKINISRSRKQILMIFRSRSHLQAYLSRIAREDAAGLNAIQYNTLTNLKVTDMPAQPTLSFCSSI